MRVEAHHPVFPCQRSDKVLHVNHEFRVLAGRLPVQHRVDAALVAAKVPANQTSVDHGSATLASSQVGLEFLSAEKLRQPRLYLSAC